MMNTISNLNVVNISVRDVEVLSTETLTALLKHQPKIAVRVIDERVGAVREPPNGYGGPYCPIESTDLEYLD